MNAVYWGIWGARRKTHTMPRGVPTQLRPGAAYGAVHVPKSYGSYGRNLYGEGWFDWLTQKSADTTVEGALTAARAQQAAGQAQEKLQQGLEYLQSQLPGAQVRELQATVERVIQHVRAGAGQGDFAAYQAGGFVSMRTEPENNVGVMFRVAFYYALGAAEAQSRGKRYADLVDKAQETLVSARGVGVVGTVLQTKGAWRAGPAVTGAWLALLSRGLRVAASGLWASAGSAATGYGVRVGGALGLASLVGYGLYRKAR